MEPFYEIETWEQSERLFEETPFPGRLAKYTFEDLRGFWASLQLIRTGRTEA